MCVANLSFAVISTPVPVETAKLYSCLTRLQSTLFNTVCISAINCIIIGGLLADVPSAVYENERVIQLKNLMYLTEKLPNSIESFSHFLYLHSGIMLFNFYGK